MSPNVFLFLLGVIITAVSGTIVQPEWKIYYNVTTKEKIDIIDSGNPRTQLSKKKADLKILRIGFGPVPCSCENLTCGCCTGINITNLNFNEIACMNFSYDPNEFSLNLKMLMNGTTIFSQSISGKNPPPACLPLLLPYVNLMVDFCIRFFNVHTEGYNLSMCMDFETRIIRIPILILHFDCMKMGVDGIHYLKPEEALTGPDIEEEGGTFEVYDEVFEEDNTKNCTTESVQKPSEKENSS